MNPFELAPLLLRGSQFRLIRVNNVDVFASILDKAQYGPFRGSSRDFYKSEFLKSVEKTRVSVRFRIAYS
jgi:hypothetical protein